MEYKPHITKKKERIVEDLVNLMKSYPVIGILDMTDLPALQFQRIKFKLKEKLEFRLVKKRLMKIAIDKIKGEKKGIESLKEKLVGVPALIFTKEDPFKIAKAIKKEVSAAPAKPGQIAPEDLVLPAGPTPFTPGPMIGELGAMGIKTKVESGKINVVDDKVLVNKGEEINDKVADLLSKVGIEPMQVGFNLLLTYRDGEILDKEVLFVDDKLYLETLQQFAREANGLAISIGYICKDTVEGMIGKAYNEAKSLSDVAKVEEKMEVPKEEEKVEEKKEEVVEKPVEEPFEEPKQEEVKEVPKEEPKEEVKEEPQQEEIKQEPVEEKVEETKEEPFEEPKEEIKEEPQQEEVKEEEPEEKTEEEKPQEETKEEPEEKKEEPKEEEKKEDEPKEEKKLEDINADGVGFKPGKDITKKDIDKAAEQLRQIQDNLIKGGK